MSKERQGVFLVVVTLLLMMSLAHAGKLYTWVDDNGGRHYSDVPSEDSAAQTSEVQLGPMNTLPAPAVLTEVEHLDEQAEARSEQGNKSMPKPASSNSGDKRISCFSGSPRSTGARLVRETLKPEEQKAVQQVFNRIAARWRGTASKIECFGDPENPKPKRTAYELDGRFSLFKNRELFGRFELYSKKEGVTLIEQLALFLKHEHLGFSTRQNDETVVLELSNQALELWAQQNTPNASPKEVVKRIEIDDRRLSIKHYLYVNGSLASMMEWELDTF